jgi:hypothetical protein
MAAGIHGHPRRLAGQCHGPQRLVAGLDGVGEMLMAGTAQHEHLLGPGGTAENLLHAVQWHGHVAVAGQDQQRHGPSPPECQGEREHARDRARAAAGRERHDSAHPRFAVGHGQGGPAAEAAAGHGDQPGIQADPGESGNRARPGEGGQQHAHVRHPARDDREIPSSGGDQGSRRTLGDLLRTADPAPFPAIRQLTSLHAPGGFAQCQYPVVPQTGR